MNIPKISLKSTIEKNKTETQITNNILINTENNKEKSVEEVVTAEYNNQNPNPYQYIVETSELNELIKQNQELTAINKASEIIIMMMKENPIYISNLIITDDANLADLIKILTGADSVQIDSEILFSGCCSAYEYKKVNAIYITKGSVVENLKYDYPQITKRLKDLGISNKFVF